MARQQVNTEYARLAALLLVLAASPALAQRSAAPAFEVPSAGTEESLAVAKLSCTNGPWRIKLPQSYKGLRSMAKLKREKMHGEEDLGTHRAQHRSLRFVGLELFVVTHSNKPDRYVLSGAVITTPAWRLAGPLRVGAPAAAALKGLPLKQFSPDAEIELQGDADTIRLTLAGGRIQEVEYDCAGG